jgi:hypothetical protein
MGNEVMDTLKKDIKQVVIYELQSPCGTSVGCYR